jgi:hypothetical protein
MDKRTKTWVVAGALGALLLAVAVGAAGAVAAQRALDQRGSRAVDLDVKPRMSHGSGRERGFGFGHLRGLGHWKRPGGLDAAATYLDLDEAGILQRLRDGETLAEIAEDEGKTVAGLVDAMTAKADERVDEAVEDGRLDEDRAAELKSKLDERVRDIVNGEVHGRLFRGPRFGHNPPGHEKRRA